MKTLVRLLSPGAIRSPGLARAADRARRAEDDWRLDEALQLWGVVCDRYGDHAAGPIGHANVLAKLNRNEEAIAELKAAAARLPDNSSVAVALARIVHDFGHHEEALRLSRGVTERFPQEPHGPELVGKCLRSLLRYDEADAVLTEARRHFPRHFGLRVEYVASADMRGDYAEGLRRAEAMLRDFPNAPTAHASVGAALKRLKRYDEADAVLSAALARFPDNSNLYVNHAWVADDRADWREALKRWTAAHRRFGREPRIRAGLLESRGRADLARIDEQAEPDAPTPAPLPGAEAGGEALSAFFMQFEGLGENCEFGFVQRHFGAEPLGLLRWAGVSFDKLLTGLESSFEGVGGPERTRMTVNPNNQEYVLSDTLYGFDMHTFLLRDEATEATTYKKMGRRLAYLKDKLLDDLAAAEKVFVFQSAQPLTDDDLKRLHAAVRRHGAGRLLAVRVAEGERRPGDVLALAEGLAAGFVDRVGFVNNHWNISFDCWLALCRGAVAQFEREAAAGQG